MIFPLGVEGSHLAASVLVSRKLVTFYLLLEGNHRNAMFCHLYSWKTEIDEELHETPYWTVSKSSNRARITVELRVDDFGDHKDWPRQHGWIIDNARSFYRAFRPRLHELKATP